MRTTTAICGRKPVTVIEGIVPTQSVLPLAYGTRTILLVGAVDPWMLGEEFAPNYTHGMDDIRQEAHRRKDFEQSSRHDNLKFIKCNY